jgi:hypothetical protein
VDTESAARRWAAVLHEAWAGGDAEPFLALYAAGASFRGPFGGPEAAEAHMRRSFAVGDGRPEVWVGEPVVLGDRAAVEWWAVLDGDGGATTFAATAWLRFDAEGRVVEENDYWQSAPGRFEPWAGWGRAQRQA